MVLTPLQRYSQCILQPQPTGQLFFFKNGLEYLTRRTARRLILIRFQLQSFSCNFLLSLIVDYCLLPISWSTCRFPSLQEFSRILDLLVLFLQLTVFLYFYLWAWYIFQLEISFLYPGCVFLLFRRISSSFQFFATTLISSMHIWQLTIVISWLCS